MINDRLSRRHVLMLNQVAPVSADASADERDARMLRDQSLGSFLKMKRIQQPHGKCRCGRTISGNKLACALCAKYAEL